MPNNTVDSSIVTQTHVTPDGDTVTTRVYKKVSWSTFSRGGNFFSGDSKQVDTIMTTILEKLKSQGFTVDTSFCHRRNNGFTTFQSSMNVFKNSQAASKKMDATNMYDYVKLLLQNEDVELYVDGKKTDKKDFLKLNLPANKIKSIDMQTNDNGKNTIRLKTNK